MAVTVREMGKSRSLSNKRTETGGSDASITLVYWINNTDDIAVAEQALLANIGATVSGMLISDYSITPFNDRGNSWEATVNYNTERLEPGDYQISIDISGGSSVKTTQAFDYTDYNATGSTYDSQGAINVDNENRPQGIDLAVPTFKFSVRARLPGVFITNSFLFAIRDLAFKKNQAEFLGFAAGEVLFEGASFELKLGEDTDVSFSFSVERNEEGLEIGGVTGIDKLGQDYLWIRHAETISADNAYLESTVDTVSVCEVRQDGDFDLLKIGQTA